MAKKNKASWLPKESDIQSAAKTSIQKTSNLDTPKKKVGRPKAIKGDTIQVQVSVEARDWLKKLAIMEETTMMEYLTDLILKNAKDKGYLKE